MKPEAPAWHVMCKYSLDSVRGTVQIRRKFTMTNIAKNVNGAIDSTAAAARKATDNTAAAAQKAAESTGNGLKNAGQKVKDAAK